MDGALITRSASSLLHAVVFGIPEQYYRPIVFLLHALDYSLFGASPTAFRATNLVLHAANAALVRRLLRVLGATDSHATGLALLFAVHPLAATPLGWASDRTDIVVLGASVAYFLIVLSYLRTPKARLLAASAAVFLVGLAAKETMVATVVVVIGAIFSSRVSDRIRLLRVFAAQLGITVVWFLWRAHVSTNPGEQIRALSVGERMALSAFIHVEYLRELLFPWSLRVCDGTRVPEPTVLWALLLVLVSSAVLAALVRARNRGRKLDALALLWSVAFLVPTSGILSIKHVRGDRYLYPALPGLIVLASSAIEAGLRRARIHGSALAFSAGAWFVCSVVALGTRTRHFSSDTALWRWEVERDPSCMEGWSNLTRDAYREHDLEAAEAALSHIEFRSDNVVAYWNERGTEYYRALILLERGEVTAAEGLLRLLAESERDGTAAEAAYELGLLAFSRGDYETSVALLTKALGGNLVAASRSDAFLLKSYALLSLNRSGESRADFARYKGLDARGADTPSHRKIEAILQSAHPDL